MGEVGKTGQPHGGQLKVAGAAGHRL